MPRIKVGVVTLSKCIRAQKTAAGQTRHRSACEAEKFPTMGTVSVHGSSETVIWKVPALPQ
jgi:hypothetical protein